MLFAYPPNAVFNRVIPKAKFYERTKPTTALKDRFVKEIAQVVWSYKLAPETINLPASDGVQELQVFTIALKSESIDESVLRLIDRSIPSPIIFEIQREKEAKSIAAYKRPSESDAASWVVERYFDTPWMAAESDRTVLPIALNMGSLYEQILMQMAPVAPRRGELLRALIERYATICAKQTESHRLAAKLSAEKQFNRKVEINARLRQLDAEIACLSDVAESN